MIPINYVVGDLFQLLPYENGFTKFIPHVCNDEQVWSSGFVLPLMEKWPKALEAHYSEPTLFLGDTQFVKVQDNEILGSGFYGDIFVCNMIAQKGTIRTQEKPIKYASLIRCMEKVKDVANIIQLKTNTTSEIHAPMFASRRACGNWSFVEELILELWSSYDIPVTIYKYDENE
jgi:hypothetical protein